MAGNGGRGKMGAATAQRTSGVVLPEGVELGETSLRRVYQYETPEGNELDFTVNNRPDPSRLPNRLLGQQLSEVEFSVNDNYVRGERLSTRESTAIALRVNAIMRADAASRPDGYQYITSATTSDGLGAARTRLYTRAGFSNSFPGEYQVAHVINGRLVPGLAQKIQ